MSRHAIQVIICSLVSRPLMLDLITFGTLFLYGLNDVSIILGYRRLSVKSLLVPEAFPPPSLLPGHYAIIKGREEGRAC